MLKISTITITASVITPEQKENDKYDQNNPKPIVAIVAIIYRVSISIHNIVTPFDILY